MNDRSRLVARSGSGPKKKILVVEDEDSMLKLESILLTSRGYEVRGVSNGQAALDALAEELPDLVLLDIMLPKVDGLEVCRRIKGDETTRHMPVILLTAMKGQDDMEHGQEVGADWYITKPFKSAVLIETIRRFLGDGAKQAPSP